MELVNGGIDNQNPTNTRFHLVEIDALNIIALTNGQLPVTQYSVGGLPPYIPNADGPTPADNDNEPYFALYQPFINQQGRASPDLSLQGYSPDNRVRWTVPPSNSRRWIVSLTKLSGIV